MTSDKIATNAITANKISANAVTAGKIAANSIIAGDGVIAALAVQTLMLANQAVTFPISASNSSPATLTGTASPGSTRVLSSVTYTASGAPVFLLGSYYGSSALNSQGVTLRIRRNGTVLIGYDMLETGSSANAPPFIFDWSDTPPAGTVTYDLVAQVVGNGNPASLHTRSRIFTLETKK